MHSGVWKYLLLLSSGHLNSFLSEWRFISLRSSGFLFFFKKYVLFLAALGLSCSRQDLSLRHEGFSLAVALGFSSCGDGLRCPLACRISVLWPGAEPESPVSEGRFLITRPPGKSLIQRFSVCGPHTSSISSVWNLVARSSLWIKPSRWLQRNLKFETLVPLPGKVHSQRSLAGYCPWGRKESEMT